MLHLIRCRSHWPLVTVLAVVAGFFSPAQAQYTGEQIYQRALKSTVWILSPVGGGRAASGTGSLIDAQRKLILTNHHVVGNREEVMVLFPTIQNGKLVAEKDYYLDQVRAGNRISGKVIKTDSKRDLAVIQLESVPQGALALLLAAKSAGPGQDVHSVGNPGQSGALWVYTSGKVRQVYNKRWRSAPDGAEREAQIVETQSPTNPGDSGGPLMNDRGELVAVTQGGALDANLLSIFIDISEVRAFLSESRLLPRTALIASTTGGTTTIEPKDKPELSDVEKMEQQAKPLLGIAKRYADNGLADKAIEKYQAIIDEFPATKAAEQAKEAIAKLKK
ncbi:MAG: trypsin-like peptidase domain-containing protein [Gemmataceae bacterium]